MIEPNIDKKEEFLKYFSLLPLQKLAAERIGIDEDTVTNWKKADSDFSERVAYAKSEWAVKWMGKVRSPEWLLERVLKEYFSERKEFKIDQPIPILPDVPTNDSKPENTKPDETD